MLFVRLLRVYHTEVLSFFGVFDAVRFFTYGVLFPSPVFLRLWFFRKMGLTYKFTGAAFAINPLFSAWEMEGGFGGQIAMMFNILTTVYPTRWKYCLVTAGYERPAIGALSTNVHGGGGLRCCVVRGGGEGGGWVVCLL